MAYVIVKMVVNNMGIEVPVILIDKQNEVLEFETKEAAEKYKDIFQSNSDSGYTYLIKKIGE